MRRQRPRARGLRRCLGESPAKPGRRAQAVPETLAQSSLPQARRRSRRSRIPRRQPPSARGSERGRLPTQDG